MLVFAGIVSRLRLLTSALHQRARNGAEKVVLQNTYFKVLCIHYCKPEIILSLFYSAMSRSPFIRQISDTKPIPTRRASDSSDLTGSYSATPGGTLYATTPGGSKIIYDKSVLLSLRNSPLSRTPPQFDIPDNVIKGSPNYKNGMRAQKRTQLYRKNSNQNSYNEEHSEQFQLEI